MVDAGDLKSPGVTPRAGSSPAPGTKNTNGFRELISKKCLKQNQRSDNRREFSAEGQLVSCRGDKRRKGGFCLARLPISLDRLGPELLMERSLVDIETP